MSVLKIIFLVIAIITVPLLTVFLIRLALKISRSVERMNRTLDDARPQFIMLLANLNQTVEDVNDELERVGQMTGEAQAMLELTESSLRAVDEALRSPVARFGGMLAGFATTTLLFRGISHRLSPRGRKPRGGRGT
ncbi:MAG: DUF948 domain-containing protein [Actinobacteria bacterium]|jgi:predicted PurR-regulated permease PerM|nr:MAG: DUF948 domain-containing protein [Actinomycetota bacterium]